MSINDRKFCGWQSLANSELYWYQTDSQELYNKHLQTKFSELQYHDWIDSTISYKFNSYGFRCKEFTDTESIMFLGCSVTLGVGLHEHQIFPNLVANTLNLQTANLGVAGSSADTGFRIAQIYLNIIKPKIVVASFLFPSRIELLADHGSVNFTPNSQNNTDHTYRKYYIDYYEKWLIQPENSELNLIKNILAIKQMCQQNNIKFVDIQMDHLEDGPGKQQYSKARDLLHPGPLTHQTIAKVILNQL